MKLIKPILHSLALVSKATIAIVIAVLVGCGVDGNTQATSNQALEAREVDRSAALFDTSRVMEIAIQMDPGQYNALRSEGRSAADVFSGCSREFDYTFFPSSVTVDGERVDDVAIRKKGFLGSLSRARPSLKLNFSNLVPGRTFKSMERMTLNNDRQDAGHANQCVAYELFRAAGLVAPRCSTAHVTMNGQDLGFYSHVESIKKPFVRRNFSNAEGNLYEAQGGDFGRFLSDFLQLKTNKALNDRSDLELVTTILGASDANFESMLSQVIDVDEFISFWAMEIITGHWDGATSNANNYHIYRNPDDGQFHYIPWGTDGAMNTGLSPLRPQGGQLYRFTRIPARLFAIPAMRERLNNRIEELLSSLWDEEQLLGRVEQIRMMTQVDEDDNAAIRGFIASNVDRLTRAIANETRPGSATVQDRARECDDSISTIVAEFEGNSGFFEITNEDGEVTRVQGAVSQAGQGGDAISRTIVGNLNGELIILSISVEASEFVVGETPFHGVASTAILVQETANGFQPSGFGGVGTITLANPDAEGLPTSGRVEGSFYVFEQANAVFFD